MRWPAQSFVTIPYERITLLIPPLASICNLTERGVLNFGDSFRISNGLRRRKGKVRGEEQGRGPRNWGLLLVVDFIWFIRQTTSGGHAKKNRRRLDFGEATPLKVVLTAWCLRWHSFRLLGKCNCWSGLRPGGAVGATALTRGAEFRRVAPAWTRRSLIPLSRGIWQSSQGKHY